LWFRFDPRKPGHSRLIRVALPLLLGSGFLDRPPSGP
jgi:hypothetical protein